MFSIRSCSSTNTLARLAGTIAFAFVLTTAQLPTFITWTQSHEAALYVASSIFRAVINALTIPAFSSPVIKYKPPPRR